MSQFGIFVGDVLAGLKILPAGTFQTCVTSPPYWGLRDYGTAKWDGGDPACDHRGAVQQSAKSTLLGNGHGGGKQLSPSLQEQRVPFREVCGKCGARRVDRQIGLESTPDEYVERMVEVFREVRRVLRDDGTCWLNLGDSYASHDPGGYREGEFLNPGGRAPVKGQARNRAGNYRPAGLKPKDLVGIPWRVAFALQADGWYLRSDIIWAKPNPMPEAVQDRPTKSHEYLFLLTKSPRYYYDAEAVKEECSSDMQRRAAKGHTRGPNGKLDASRQDASTLRGEAAMVLDTSNGRNRRSVWTVNTKPYKGAHFATFPPELIRPCIRAGASVHGRCGDCGAPFERMVERGTSHYEELGKFKGSVLAPESTDPRNAANGGGQTRLPSGAVPSLHAASTITTGWVRTCRCISGVEPSIVLDPFVGSGTTGVVAHEEGMHCIGVELNPAYVELARERYLKETGQALNVRAVEEVTVKTA